MWKKKDKKKHLKRKYNLGEVKYPIKNNYEANQAMRQKKIMYHEVSQFEEAQIWKKPKQVNIKNKEKSFSS